MSSGTDGAAQRRVCGSSGVARAYAVWPQHFLYFFPLPQGHGSFGLTFLAFAAAAGAPDDCSRWKSLSQYVWNWWSSMRLLTCLDACGAAGGHWGTHGN